MGDAPGPGDGDFGERLAAVLGRTVPGFGELVSWERLSGGASQETYRITIRADGHQRLLAMRRAPGGITSESSTGPGLATEAELMRRARDAGVPEPEVLAVLEPGDGMGDGFVMEWLDGETLGARIVRSPELADVRPRLARQCGEILARIHGIDVGATGLDQRLETLTPTDLIHQSWDRYQTYGTPQPMIDFTARWLLENLPTSNRVGLVHNDFRNGNIMVTNTDGVVAVLDWEIAHIGDPLRDLGWVCTNSWRFGKYDLPVGGFGTYDDLLAGYESVSGSPVDPDHVRFWEVFGSFWWAVGCLGMAEHYRTGPDRTVERPAIGRRTSECQIDCVNLIIPGPVELVPPTAGSSALDMPTVEELLTSVRDFLRDDVMDQTQGRTSFLARVAANSLDVVLRQLELGPAHRRLEHELLAQLMGDDGDLESLRWKLVGGLRDGSIALDRPGLATYLRTSVANQAAIDQPRYSGFRHALEQSAQQGAG